MLEVKKGRKTNNTILMKSIKLGKLIFNRKAIFLIAFCLFLNGVLIGALVAYNQDANESINVILLLFLIFLPYLLFYKSIGKNITEMN